MLIHMCSTYYHCNVEEDCGQYETDVPEGCPTVHLWVLHWETAVVRMSSFTN